MILVAGLGNPGSEYASTKHNIGFLAVDEIGSRVGIELNKKKFYGSYGKGFFNKEKLILLKPETYMNRSGESVSSAANFYHIPSEKIIVVHDEMDLPTGSVRIKAGGGSAGHKGINSIIQRIGDREFIRVRIGIGKPEEKSGGASHVLARFEKNKRDIVQDSILRAADAVLDIIENGVERAMNKFNTKADKPENENNE
ncbi:MAG: aminoacyl-tRNA hydrolase [Deltaproteobacteria bacterium]